MSKSYTVYHLHSDFSLLDSTSKFEEYVDLAVEQGMTAIASTEHGKTSGWIEKKLLCDQRGIKFIHGVEIYLTEQLEPKVRDNYHTILLAKNESGIRELNRLIKVSSDPDHFYYTNRLSFDEFLGISDNIIKTSACLASPLNKLADNHPRYMELALHYDYYEVQPHICSDQALFNKRLSALSKKTGIPLSAGTDTHTASKYKAECRSVLMKYKDQSYDGEDDFDLTWKTREELYGMFLYQGALSVEEIEAAIENTNVIADSVEDFTLDRSIKYPILYGSRENDSLKFDELIQSKFDEKLRLGIIPEYQEPAFRLAIEEEVRVFRKLHMDGFMLAMAELVGWCKSQGMAIGPARGSVGGSRVAYITDIIDLNPETWHTVFSRFCNEDREEIGDIDIDVVESDRPAIFEYIVNRFGSEHTARVGAYGTLADLATIEAIAGALRKWWEEEHHPENFTDRSKRVKWQSYKYDDNNPWIYKKVDRIKKEFSENAEAAKGKYPQLFYYFDGLHGTRSSQSVHPAGIIISPINLVDAYGTFDKDGDQCLVLDMDAAHEVGLAKFDFLVLKTVTVIRDTCRLIGRDYPKSHEINWDDEEVWRDMLRSPGAIFQMEGKFAFDSLKKFRPSSIFDMSLVTAAIRPSGASYRDQLLSRIRHNNPSPIIDDLLKENLGYLIYQEDTIKFLQEVCGLSGSAADNVRRAIGRKQKERLDAAMPSILEGYCSKSPKPRAEAESEAKEFLQIIEDSASYQFGYNHSVAYCLLGYLCAYFRYYYPVQFITAFLNNAANDDDISNGTMLAKTYGIRVTSPRFGVSGGAYACDCERRIIAKGISSIKFMGDKIARQIQSVSGNCTGLRFVDVLSLLHAHTDLDARQLSILIHIDFFADYGNQRELENILRIFDMFKQGDAKQIKKERIAGSYFEEIVSKNAIGTNKDGSSSANWKLMDVKEILNACEDRIKSLNLQDLGVLSKVRSFKEAMGYAGYISGKEEDRAKLYIRDVFPVKRKKDGKQFGYNVLTQSVGSGIESKFTVFNQDYIRCGAIRKDDIIICKKWYPERGYFTMTNYSHIRTDYDLMEDL